MSETISEAELLEGLKPAPASPGVVGLTKILEQVENEMAEKAQRHGCTRCWSDDLGSPCTCKSERREILSITREVISKIRAAAVNHRSGASDEREQCAKIAESLAMGQAVEINGETMLLGSMCQNECGAQEATAKAIAAAIRAMKGGDGALS